MRYNEPTTLSFREGNELKIDIGGGIQATVVMEGPTAAVTYITTVPGSPIISESMMAHKHEFIQLLENNFPSGKVEILYDGSIDTSGLKYKAHISRIVITKPLSI